MEFRPFFALVAPLLCLSSCDRSEIDRLRAENEALKSGTVTAANAANSSQVKAVIKALRKVKGAVSTGINLRDYDQLIRETSMEMEAELPEIPAGTFTENVNASFLAFKDALDFWRLLSPQYLDAVLKPDQKKQFEKYDLVWLDRNRGVSPHGNVVNKLSYQTNLTKMWEEGERRLKIAEDMLK